jgi:hypothetical protein
MPKRNQRGKKSKKRNGGASKSPMLSFDAGAIGRFIGLPVGRIPVSIGSNRNLSAVNAVYPRMVKLDSPIIPQFASMVAGGTTLNLACTVANLVENFASRFGSLFGEYCLVGLRFEIRVNSVVNPAGIYLAWFNEKGTAAPGATEALNTPHIEGIVSNTESPSSHVISWRATDYLDLDWSDNSATTVTPVSFKLYSNTAATGTTATTTAQFIITGAASMCFRAYDG